MLTTSGNFRCRHKEKVTYKFPPSTIARTGTRQVETGGIEGVFSYVLSLVFYFHGIETNTFRLKGFASFLVSKPT